MGCKELDRTAIITFAFHQLFSSAGHKQGRMKSTVSIYNYARNQPQAEAHELESKTERQEKSGP